MASSHSPDRLGNSILAVGESASANGCLSFCGSAMNWGLLGCHLLSECGRTAGYENE